MDRLILCPSCMGRLTGEQGLCPHCGKAVHAENSEDCLPVGTVLNNRFLVGCKIGGGGFGIVYIGYDIMLGYKVAIKEYYPRAAANRSNSGEVLPLNNSSASFQRGLMRFREECKILMSLSDDANIVTLKDFFSENGTAYMVMEYLSGSPLSTVAQRHGKFSSKDAIDLLAPMAECIERLHARGYVHGDLSLSNIIFTEGGVMKLIDFGATWTIGEASSGDASVFKHGYAPEECYRTDASFGAWTDVYSYCAMLYKLITNTLPEGAADRLIEDHLAKPSKLGAKISPAHEAAIMKGLSVLAKDRPQTMTALKREFCKTPFPKKPVLIASVLALAAVLIFTIPTLTARLSSGGSSQTSPSTSDTAPKREKPKAVTLRDDAFPIPVYAGVERMDVKLQTILSDENMTLDVTDVLCGNGKLYLSLDFRNLSSKTVKLSSFFIDTPADFVSSDPTLYTVSISPKNIYQTTVCFDLGELSLNGVRSTSQLSLYAIYQLGEERVYFRPTLSFPEMLPIEPMPNAGGVSIYSASVKNRDGESKPFELFCHGMLLQRDHYKANLYFTSSYDLYGSLSCDIYLKELSVDGKQIRTGNNLSAFGYSGRSVILNIPYAAEIAPVDEMNVMHSGVPFPEQIELKLALVIDNGEEIELEPMLFTIDENGNGKLVK